MTQLARAPATLPTSPERATSAHRAPRTPGGPDATRGRSSAGELGLPSFLYAGYVAPPSRRGRPHR